MVPLLLLLLLLLAALPPLAVPRGELCAAAATPSAAATPALAYARATLSAAAAAAICAAVGTAALAGVSSVWCSVATTQSDHKLVAPRPSVVFTNNNLVTLAFNYSDNEADQDMVEVYQTSFSKAYHKQYKQTTWFGEVARST